MPQYTNHSELLPALLGGILFSILSRVKKNSPRFMLLQLESFQVTTSCLQQYMANSRSSEAGVWALV